MFLCVLPLPGTPRPEVAPCQFEMSGLQGLISNENITEERLNYTITYNYPIDCTWVVRVRPNEKVRETPRVDSG